MIWQFVLKNMHVYLIEGACGKIICLYLWKEKKWRKCIPSIHYDDFIPLAIETYGCFDENPLRCTTQDEKSLVFTTILFYPIFWSP
jgi:hypothetical protein